MKIFYLFGLVVLLVACNKEYYPDEDAYRDSDLFGTWVSTKRYYSNINDVTFIVYTENGYKGVTNYVAGKFGSSPLDGIWSVELANQQNNHRYNQIHEQKRFRYGFYKNSADYFFSVNKDTLFRHYDDYIQNKWDTLVKPKYQLIYNGANFVGVDSTGGNRIIWH